MDKRSGTKFSTTTNVIPGFNELVMKALAASDEPFTRPIVRHWKAFKQHETVSALSDFLHIDSHEFSRDHMVKMLGHQRNALVEAMKKAQDIQSFKHSCLSFINHEMDNLFFVTNDEHQAQLARDYFDTFMDGLVAHLDKGNPLKKQIEQLCKNLKDYYGISLGAYQTMAEDLWTMTSNGDPEHPQATQSLVQFALKSNAATPEEQEFADTLLSDKEAVLDPEKSTLIKNISKEYYDKFMEKRYGTRYKNETDVRPLVWWISHRLELIASQRYSKELQQMPADDTEGFKAFQPKLRKEEKRILAGLDEYIKGKEEPERTVIMVMHLDELHAQASGLPVSYPAVLPQILETAQEYAHKVLSQNVHEYTVRISERPVPVAHQRPCIATKEVPFIPSLAEANIPEIALNPQSTKEDLKNHTIFVRKNLDIFLHSFVDEVTHTNSLEELNAGENSFLQSLASNVYLGAFSPASLLCIEHYFKNIRQGLEQYLEKEGFAKQHQTVLESLARNEEKCKQLYESYFICCDWLMDLTNGAHERAVLPAYLHEASKSGKKWMQYGPGEQQDIIYPKAMELLCHAMKSKGIAERDMGFLAPYIFEQCVEIAANEIEERRSRKDFMTSERKAPQGPFTQKLLHGAAIIEDNEDSYAKKIKDRAFELFDNAMALAPTEDDMFSPDHLADVRAFLKHELARHIWSTAPGNAAGYTRH